MRADGSGRVKERQRILKNAFHKNPNAGRDAGMKTAAQAGESGDH